MDHSESSDLSSVAAGAAGNRHGERHRRRRGKSPRNDESPVIAKKETTTVIYLKLVVVFVLVVSTICAAVTVLRYTRGSEESKFRDRFESDANKVIEAIESSLEKTLSAFDSLSITMVSFANYTNATWPFVTLPNFGLRVSKMLPESNALFVNVLPLVRPDERKRYEAYTLLNDDWVNESLALQQTWDGYYGPDITSWEPNPILHAFEDLPYENSRDYLPNWQTFPTIPIYAPYGYDWLASTETSAMRSSLESHKATVSAAYMLPKKGDKAADEEADLWEDFYKDYIGPEENAREPVSDLFYPIINELDRVNVVGIKDYDPTQHEVVGLLAAPFYWRAMIRASDSKGIVVVFDSPCNEAFSYQVDGTRVKYLGVGDQHDNKYDGLFMEKVLTGKRSDLDTVASYSGAPLNTELCPVTVKLYPSDEMKDDFTTSGPLIFTLGAVGIFLFTSLVFVLYDYYVERRQKLVLSTATRSSAIVSSLFPSQVRDQLYPTTGSTTKETNSGSIQKFLSASKGTDNEDLTSYKQLSGTPIAELYTDTTVFFADIAGFTSWSAQRSPTQVFHLLETLYGAFDEIADRHGVFKVETIGDSYVAVVGLPVPRKHHAVVMARFAQECMDVMSDVTRDLERSLGEGTVSLAIRVGLNSGETTAGVLRGAKARFQLFGDTVNTAARMESNGECNRIHVTQQTADLIALADKSHWLSARSDKIDAKGKGKLQTYWCNPKAESNGGGGAERATSVGTGASSSGMSIAESEGPLCEL